jgi:chromosomal replication initiation ATPase DnaA
MLCGPRGSGKTHLVAIWRARSEAAVLRAGNLSAETVAGVASAPAIAIEDLDEIAVDEGALFHLLNIARERGVTMMATSGVPPARLAIVLPDLVSRLRAAHLVSLGPPDDELLRRVLVKLFADRQLAVDPQVIDYIVVRMERSFAAADVVVDTLDRVALAAGKPISRPLATAALAGLLRRGDAG